MENATNCKEYALKTREVFGHMAVVFIIIGTSGNLLSLIVFLRSKMRIHSTFMYLAMLSVFDSLVIYFGLLRDFLAFKFKINIHGQIPCKIHVFLFYFFLHMCSWLMVSVNVDRLVVVSFIRASKSWCTPRKALLTSLSLTLVMFACNCHFLFYAKSTSDMSQETLEEDETEVDEVINPYVYKKCIIDKQHVGYYYFIKQIYPFIDASIQVFIPFGVMIFCNLNIIFRVLLSKKKLNSSGNKHMKKVKGMCVMIVSLSLLFLTFESPILIFICLSQLNLIHTHSSCAEILWILMNAMMYVNHISNFFVYTLTSTKFRQELKDLVSSDERSVRVEGKKTLLRKSIHYRSATSFPKHTFNRVNGTSVL